MREKILRSLYVKHPDLPILPDILIQLQQLLADPNKDIDDLCNMIKVDAVLSGKILTLANSALLKREDRRITSIDIAAQKIGLREISQLIYSFELTKLFSENTVVSSYHFWRHSLAVALLTQYIHDKTRVSGEELEVSYFAGLMHDIGIMVFASLLKEEYLDFLETISDSEEPLQVLESKKFGIDHAELGAIFTDTWWSIDLEITRAIRYQHTYFAESASEKKIIELVNIATGVCNAYGLTNGIENDHVVLYDGDIEELALTKDDLKAMVDNAGAAILTAETMMLR